MYESPIAKVFNENHTQLVKEEENMIIRAVRQVGINVDKNELLQALQYDRKQYIKGYSDGKSDTLDKIRAEIEQKARPNEIGGRGNGKLIRYGLYMALEIIDKYKSGGEE